MFELLLQADRTLSDGNLDQAEGTYRQLIELDPTNAIAIAGLARVALERGDVRLARTFAARALALDPESVTAKRIVETIDKGGDDMAQAPEQVPADLPLMAAQRLEALGRRRLGGGEGADGTPPPRQVTGKLGGGEDADGTPPLRQKRRKARRQVAAEAAETAPRPNPAPPRRPAGRPDFHLAPIPGRGHRHFEPEEMRAPPLARDPFAAAESEAAVEAVVEVDDVTLEEAPRRASSHTNSAAARTDVAAGARPEARPEATPATDLLEADATTGADESVALPLALVGETPPAVEEAGAAASAPVAEPGDAAAEDSMAASVVEPEAPTSVSPAEPDSQDDLAALRIALLAGEIGPEAAEREAALPGSATGLDESDFDAAERGASEASQTTGSEEDDLIALRLARLPGNAELEAAEREAASGIPTFEVEPTVETNAGEPAIEAETQAADELPRPPSFGYGRDHEPTEDEAEVSALFEAMTLVLGGGSTDADLEPMPTESVETSPAVAPQAEAAKTEPPESAPPQPTPRRRRRGFLRRIIGD